MFLSKYEPLFRLMLPLVDYENWHNIMAISDSFTFQYSCTALVMDDNDIRNCLIINNGIKLCIVPFDI